MASIFNQNTNPLLYAHNGPALIFHAPYGTSFPTSISDVVKLTGTSSTQWKPQTGWACLGSTKSGIKVERGFTKVDRTSDQSFGPFDMRPNHWTASVTSELLETTPTTLQIAWEGAPVVTNSVGESTTLSADGAAGAAAVAVTTVGSIASGSLIIIGTNLHQEWHEVAAVSSTTVTFAAGETLDYAQASGSYVLLPGVQSVAFGHPRSITPRVLAVIAPLPFVNTTAKGTTDLLRMWAFRIVRLGEGNKTMNLTQDNDWVLPVSFQAYRDASVSDGNIDTLQVFELTT